MGSSVSLALMEPQFGDVDDKVHGLVVFLLGGQSANLCHLGVDPTNKHIKESNTFPILEDNPVGEQDEDPVCEQEDGSKTLCLGGTQGPVPPKKL